MESDLCQNNLAKLPMSNKKQFSTVKSIGVKQSIGVLEVDNGVFSFQFPVFLSSHADFCSCCCLCAYTAGFWSADYSNGSKKAGRF